MPSTDLPGLKPQYSNLSKPTGPLIGRKTELAQLLAILGESEVRLLTLTGPGGVGKTRLAFEVASHLSNQFELGLVSLAPIASPDLVVPTIAQVLGLKETGPVPLATILKSFLQDKQVLLLLDNFEHLLEAAPALAELLEECPRLKILVTSRAALHLRAEQEFQLPSLALPDPNRLPPAEELLQYDGIALWVQRARAIRADFQLTAANAPTIVQICRRLDGLPLALELAAARLRALQPQEILNQLSNRAGMISLLNRGPRDLPPRQQTLRATLEWSYELLSPPEKQLFRSLAVFVGGFTLEAARAIAGEEKPGPTLDLVEGLIDKNLLKQIEERPGVSRYLMLQTIREFALEVLQEAGEEALMRQRHAQYYLALVQAAEPRLRSSEQLAWLQRLLPEYDNLRAALHWADEQAELAVGLQLASALYWFWARRSNLREGQDWFEKFLEHPTLPQLAEKDRLLVAQALNRAGGLAWLQGRFGVARSACEKALAQSVALGDKHGEGLAQAILGLVDWQEGKLVSACQLIEKGVALFRAVGDGWYLAWALFCLGNVLRDSKRISEAREAYTESQKLYRAVGDRWGLAWPLGSAAFIDYLNHNVSQARPSFEEAQTIFQEIEDKRSLLVWGRWLAEIRWCQGEIEQAAALFEECLALYRELKMEDFNGWVQLRGMGVVALHRNDLAQAQLFFQEALQLWARFGKQKNGLAGCLFGFAMVKSHDPAGLAVAARALGAIATFGETAPLSPFDRQQFERGLALLSERLDSTAFEVEFARGRKQSLEQALAELQADLKLSSAEPAPASVPAPAPALTERRWQDLTSRELEVLSLVAQGLSDNQIAQQLVISPRTVQGHLYSIYSKLDVPSRSAAIRYALDHKLLA